MSRVWLIVVVAGVISQTVRVAHAQCAMATLTTEVMGITNAGASKPMKTEQELRDDGKASNEVNLCLYRCWTQTIDGKQHKMQSCMPSGGINDIKDAAVGSTVVMANGTKYQVVNCKFPGCL